MPLPKESSLVSLIEKKNHTGHGIFADISSDINEYFGAVYGHDTMEVTFERHGDIDDHTRMAYGYASRVIGAGAYIQGGIRKEDYNMSRNIFKLLQLTTNHSKEFQIEAASQADKFIASYDPRLSADLVHLMVSMVESGFDNSFLNGQIDSYEKTISMLIQTKNRAASE